MSNREPLTYRDVLSPDKILGKMIKDYVKGVFDNYTFLYRAVVVKIDHVGGKFKQEPLNPKNSIIARVVTSGRDSGLDDEDLGVYWPFFTHDVMPLKEGEHVYVWFEDNNNKRGGLWVTRAPESDKFDDKNLILRIQKIFGRTVK